MIETLSLPEQAGLMAADLARIDRVVCFIGANGAGKTRLLKAAHGHLSQQGRRCCLIQADTPLPDNLRFQSVTYVGSQELVAREVEDPTANGARVNWPAYIALMCDQYHRATHPGSESQDWAPQARTRYDSLAENVRLLLGAELRYKPNQWGVEVFIGGESIDQAKRFSEGQRELLAYATRIAAQGHSMRGLQLFVDEPERHLHPAAICELVAILLKSVGDGRLWLATHSPSILSLVDENDVCVVRRGEKPAWRQPGLVPRAIRQLLGAGEAVNALRRVLDEPYEWAMTQFSAECLLPARVVDFDQKDPQLALSAMTLHASNPQEGRIRVLDYGAGAGRLAQHFARNEVCRLIRYQAVDLAVGEALAQSVSQLRRADADAHDGDPCTLDQLPEGKTYDRVVLCNVLHEIPPSDWEAVLGKLRERLAEGGSLLILEDLEMSIGELPNEIGYFVLNAEELETLFGLQPKVYRYQSQERPDLEQRLLAVEVPKWSGKLHVRESLERLEQRSLQEILALRARRHAEEPDVSRRAGRALARATAAVANVRIALSSGL